MALDANIVGLGGTKAEVTAENRVKVQLTNDSRLPDEVGCVRVFAENDTGAFTGAAQNMSAETDLDFRQRQALDTCMEQELFDYTAQNTNKHSYRNTTMTNAWTVNGLQTNSGSITTTTTGTLVQSYRYFPILGTSTLSADMEIAFSALPVANTVIDFGLFLAPTSNPYAPTDGAYFRLSSAGLSGVINYNGTETTIGPFANLETGAAYTANKKYQFILYINQRRVEFWYNDGTDPSATYLLGVIDTPTGNGQPCMSASLPFSMRHAIVGGAAGGTIQATMSAVSARLGGYNFADSLSAVGNRCYGSYAGLSGGTMGSLATYPNSTNPTAAAPSNTALTANLPAGLGGQGLVTAAAAAATDGIWGEYAVPSGTVSVQGRTLVIRGLRVDAVNMGAAVATTATTLQFSLASGHTAVSMATAEAAAAKAPRRIPLGFMNWPIGAAIGAQPDRGPIVVDFGHAPVYVNQGERVALVAKFINGTATASQTIQFTWTPIYGWE